MRKITKELFTGVVALGLLAPVATSVINPVRTTVSAKRVHHHRRSYRHHRRSHRRWHKGTPKILGGNSVWISNPRKTSHSKRFRYTRIVTPLGGHYGINPTPFSFNNHHHFTVNGADASATLAVHPHFKVLSHHKYEVESGDRNSGHVHAKVIYHKRGRVSIYVGHHYLGYFHKVSHRTAHHFEYHPYF